MTYIITLIDDGFLQLSTVSTKKEMVLDTVKRWHEENWSESNDEGYIAVEVAKQEGEVAERIVQINLDCEPHTIEYDWEIE